MLELIKDFIFIQPPTQPHIAQIPAKFHPFIINHPAFKGPKSLKESAAQVFGSEREITWHSHAARPVRKVLSYFGLARGSTTQQPVSEEKPFIRTSDALPGYIIKQQRTDDLESSVAPDALLYRLRKAKKIRATLTHSEQEIVGVPHKYLYYDHNRGQWFLIAEKFSGLEQNSTVPLRAQHLKILTKLAFEANLEDMHRGNIQYSNDLRKWCIVDTEPLSRLPKKAIRSLPLSLFWLDSLSLRTFIALQSLPLMFANHPEALAQYPTPEQKEGVNEVKCDYLQTYFKNSARKAGLLIVLACALPCMNAGLGAAANCILLGKVYALGIQVGIILSACGRSTRARLVEQLAERRPYMNTITLRPMLYVWNKSPPALFVAAAALWVGCMYMAPGYLFAASVLESMISTSAITAATFLTLQRQASQSLR